MVRLHVISAIFWRNVAQYFSGVLGYLFIVVFVTLCALASFSQQFFVNNVATLDQLTQWLPTLLLFLAPAITMMTWADERRQGTDALLFTLPASDIEVVLGKYFSVVAVYTVALIFSMTQLIALRMLGQPDWGIICATYFGYWLVGLSLLAIGMFASSLTDSPTVAFVLGAALCQLPVAIGSYFRGNAYLERWGIDWHLRDFSLGLVTAAGVLYFLSLIIFFLYLNLIMISRRHWRSQVQAPMWARYIIRLVAIGVTLFSLSYIVTANSTSSLTRVDLTEEQGFSLDDMTLETLEKLKSDDRSVTIQAFVSTDVPRSFVDARQRFMGTLRQLDYYGGANVDVQVFEVAPNSQEAEQAESMGIEAQTARSEVGGKRVEENVYLGAYISSSLDDVTIPTIDHDSAIEYELTRAIAATSQKDWQITIGIVDTDTRFGSFEEEGQRVSWAYDQTLKSLQQSFKVVYIAQPDLKLYAPQIQGPELDPETGAPLADSQPTVLPPSLPAPDVMLVADPASLSAEAAEALVAYMAEGNPTLLLVDPLPFNWAYVDPARIGVLNAPRQARISSQSRYFRALASEAAPKADGGTALQIMSAIGVQWNNGRAAWTLSNPHPSFAGFWPNYLGDRWPEYYGQYDYAFNFVVRNEDRAFNPDNPISSQLKEVLFFYPGSIRPESARQDVEFTPLISLGKQSGTIDWEELTLTPSQKTQSVNPLTRRIEIKDTPLTSPITGSDLIVINPRPKSSVDEDEHIVAAHIKGLKDNRTNVVVIADLDFLASVAYEQEQALQSSLDNYRLLQNTIEVLAGKSGFVALRNRRSVPRTLTAFEKNVAVYREQRAVKEKENELAIEEQLTKARQMLEESLSTIESDQSTNFFEKLQQSSQTQLDAQEQFDRKRVSLEKQLRKDNDRLKAQEARQVSQLENFIRLVAVGLAPLPALLLGIFVFFRRAISESSQVRPDRKVQR